MNKKVGLWIDHRKAVIVIRERNGNTLPAVFKSEKRALDFIRRRIAPGTIVNVILQTCT